jgi:hypothetical protein
MKITFEGLKLTPAQKREHLYPHLGARVKLRFRADPKACVYTHRQGVLTSVDPLRVDSSGSLDWFKLSSFDVLPNPKPAAGSMGVAEVRVNLEEGYYDERLEVFRKDALEAVGLSAHPNAGKAWNFAWSRGHSGGLVEVVSELQDLAEVLL